MKIQIDGRFNSAKFDSNVKLRNIVDQLTMVLYGEKLNSCLGHAMNIRKNAIEDKKIEVCIPTEVWNTADHTDYRYQGYGGMRRKVSYKLQDYMHNIIAHGNKNGLVVRIVLV